MPFLKKNQRVVARWLQKIRIWKYRKLSTFSGKIHGIPSFASPCQFVGKGTLSFENNVQLGYYPAPRYYDGLIYLEVRSKEASISFGEGTIVNNNLIIICANTSVSIGKNVLIGHDVEILDSDLHPLQPELRLQNGSFKSKPVTIGNNVFIGSCVKILKGVEIGDNSVVAHSSVVTKSVPSNVIIAGNPAKIIKNI